MPEIQKKMIEVITRIYEHGEGEGNFRVATWMDKGLKETVIECGEVYRFREKIEKPLDKSKIIK